jgi:hypothetical protein
MKKKGGFPFRFPGITPGGCDAALLACVVLEVIMEVL